MQLSLRNADMAAQHTRAAEGEAQAHHQQREAAEQRTGTLTQSLQHVEQLSRRAAEEYKRETEQLQSKLDRLADALRQKDSEQNTVTADFQAACVRVRCNANAARIVTLSLDVTMLLALSRQVTAAGRALTSATTRTCIAT